MRHQSCPSRAVLLLTLLAASASPAAAQLGKLKKMGADAVKEAAAGKKPEAKDPTAARVDYTITEERLSSIITVLTPFAVSAQREADARAASAAYEAKYKAANECITCLLYTSPSPRD